MFNRVKLKFTKLFVYCAKKMINTWFYCVFYVYVSQPSSGSNLRSTKALKTLNWRSNGPRSSSLETTEAATSISHVNLTQIKLELEKFIENKVVESLTFPYFTNYHNCSSNEKDITILLKYYSAGKIQHWVTDNITDDAVNFHKPKG